MYTVINHNYRTLKCQGKALFLVNQFSYLSLLNSEESMRREVELELSPHLKYVAALPCEMSSGQLNCTPLHSYSENNILVSFRRHLFHEFLFVYYFSS